MRIPIRSWRDQRVLFEAEAADIREALVAAVGAGAHLSEADLRRADLREADLVRANLLGATIPWQSREVIAEILRRAAGDDVDKRMVAGLVDLSRDLDSFLKIEHSLRGWALDTLAACVVDGDGAPEAIAGRARDLREQAGA